MGGELPPNEPKNDRTKFFSLMPVLCRILQTMDNNIAWLPNKTNQNYDAGI